MYAIRSYYEAGNDQAEEGAEKERGPEAGIKETGPEIVITSYSIHYTKLYDAVEKGSHGRHPLKDQGLHLRRQGQTIPPG